MPRHTRLFASQLVFGFLLLAGCTSPGRNEPLTGCIQKPTSVAEIETLLKSPLTVRDVEAKFGPPLMAPTGNWGNLMYRLPDNGSLVFWFKGPHVTGARYGLQEIEGVQPKSYRLKVEYDSSAKSYYYAVEGNRLRTYEALKEFLETLPQGTLLEHQTDCVTFTSQPPLLRTQEELNALKTFCEQKGIVFIHYPAG